MKQKEIRNEAPIKGRIKQASKQGYLIIELDAPYSEYKHKGGAPGTVVESTRPNIHIGFRLTYWSFEISEILS